MLYKPQDRTILKAAAFSKSPSNALLDKVLTTYSLGVFKIRLDASWAAIDHCHFARQSSSVLLRFSFRYASFVYCYFYCFFLCSGVYLENVHTPLYMGALMNYYTELP